MLLVRPRSLIRNRADWTPVAVVCGGVALAFWPFVHRLSLPALFAVAAVALVLRSIAPLHQHHHSHHPIFRRAWANHLYDLILLAAAGNTTAVWELQHVRGHHRTFLDAKNDVAGTHRFRAGNGVWHRVEFTLRADALTVVDSYRIALAQKRPWPHLLRLTAQLAMHAMIIVAAWRVDWRAALLLVVLSHALLRWMVVFGSYKQHHGAPSHDVYSGSFTRFGWQNRIFLNGGHHTAHHEKPTLHWTRLPERTREILNRIPRELILGG